MICTNCGQNVPDIANVCGHCGHRLKAETVSQQQSKKLHLGETGPGVSSTPNKPIISGVQQQLTWSFVLLWAGSYIIGYTPRRFYAVLIDEFLQFDFYGIYWKWQSVIEYLVGGFVVGLIQWLILRKKIGISFAWVVFTAGGLLVAGGLDLIFSFNLYLSMVYGAIASFGQWILLRRILPKAYWWIIINSAAWLMAFIISFSIGFGPYLLHAIFGFFTGYGMLWLFRQEGPRSPSAIN